MKSVLDALRGAVLGDERLLASAGERLGARDCAAAARDARTVLGRSPDHPQALETLTTALLGLDDMDGATDAWRRRQALDRTKTWEVRLCHDALIRPEPGAAGTAYVAELEDVVVDTTYWAIVDGDRLYNVEAYNGRMANSPFVGRRVSADEKRLIVAYPADAPLIEQRCIFVGGDENYSHWITRSLLKLGLVDGPDYAGLPLLLHQPFRRFHVEFLELLDVARERLIQVTESGVVRCRRLVVPTQLSLRPGFAAGVAWLRRRLAQKLGPVPGPAEDLLFLSRAGTQLRVLVNEAELAAALAPGRVVVHRHHRRRAALDREAAQHVGGEAAAEVEDPSRPQPARGREQQGAELERGGHHRRRNRRGVVAPHGLELSAGGSDPVLDPIEPRQRARDGGEPGPVTPVAEVAREGVAPVADQGAKHCWSGVDGGVERRDRVGARGGKRESPAVGVHDAGESAAGAGLSNTRAGRAGAARAVRSATS